MNDMKRWPRQDAEEQRLEDELEAIRREKRKARLREQIAREGGESFIPGPPQAGTDLRFPSTWAN